MRFVHYTEFPIRQLFDMGQSKDYSLKPRGLWISDEDDYGWKEWCSKNAPTYLGSMSYEITLGDTANILWLKTPEDIEAFTYCYRKILPEYISDYTIAIAWDKVAEEYDGIIITPYQWSRRLGTPTVWYYAWDVASGCIWNMKAIKNIEEILWES